MKQPGRNQVLSDGTFTVLSEKQHSFASPDSLSESLPPLFSLMNIPMFDSGFVRLLLPGSVSGDRANTTSLRLCTTGEVEQAVVQRTRRAGHSQVHSGKHEGQSGSCRQEVCAAHFSFPNFVFCFFKDNTQQKKNGIYMKNSYNLNINISKLIKILIKYLNFRAMKSITENK